MDDESVLSRSQQVGLGVVGCTGCAEGGCVEADHSSLIGDIQVHFHLLPVATKQGFRVRSQLCNSGMLSHLSS